MSDRHVLATRVHAADVPTALGLSRLSYLAGEAHGKSFATPAW